MKSKLNLLLAAVITVVVGSSLQAQQYIGIRVGGNFADTRTTGLITSLTQQMDRYTGWTVGAMAELPLTSDISFRPEINFIQKGFITPISTDIKLFSLDVPVGIKTKTRLNYVETPLLMQYAPKGGNNGWYIFAGPSVGYLVDGEIRPVASLIIDVNLPKVNIPLNTVTDRFEVAGVAGLGIKTEVGKGKIFADARYQYGFTNVLKNPIVDIKVLNQGFSVTAGYAYQF